MNILLVGKGSKDYPSPVGNIINNLVGSPTFANDYFYILCAKSKFTRALKGPNFEHLEYDDYVITHKEISKKMSVFDRLCFFLKKIVAYIYSHIFIDYDFFSYFFARKKARRLCQNIKVDCVIALAGVFSSFDLATALAKKLKVPLVLYYFDIFSPEDTMHGNRLARHKEAKWQKHASVILMPKSYRMIYADYGFDTKKYVDCLFPSFLNITVDRFPQSKDIPTNKDIIYAGGFYHNLREPDEFLQIASLLKKGGFRVVCYGQSKNAIIRKFGPSPSYDNVVWKDKISQDDLLIALHNSYAFINVENKYGVRFPSKMLQYLGFGKLIINLNAGRKRISEYLDEDYQQILSSDDYYKSITDDKELVDKYIQTVVNKAGLSYPPVLLNEAITERLRKTLLGLFYDDNMN